MKWWDQMPWCLIFECWVLKSRQSLKKQRHHFADKIPSTPNYGFSSSHVGMWELNHKEGWTPKNQCFWTVALENTFESHLGSKEIKPVNPKGNQCYISTRRTDAEAEALTFWPPDAKGRLIGKDPDVGNNWRQEEKGMTEDEIVGWHHRLNGHESEQTLGNSEGQEAGCAAVHGVAKSQTWLSDWTTTI